MVTPRDPASTSSRQAPDADSAPVLGYLFWHAPNSTVECSDYEAAISQWHRVLADAQPVGFEQSWTWRLSSPPWLAAWPKSAYLDVYVVGGFSALGALNASAPRGRLRAHHDLLAGTAAWGSGALFARRTGHMAGGLESTWISWYDKPTGVSYLDMVAALAEGGGSVWLRQMVLGAGPELLLVGDGPGLSATAPVWATQPTLLG